MNPEAQKIAIAKICGWKIVECHKDKNIPTNLLAWERGPECKMTGNLPDYPRDLNAMHEAEKFIDVIAKYTSMLLLVCGGPMSVHFATAAQRAEAFLKTFNRWEE